jgi:hypothetical protein
MKEPEKPYVLERIKDVLNSMKIKPSSRNSLIVYNLLLKEFKEEIVL